VVDAVQGLRESAEVCTGVLGETPEAALPADQAALTALDRNDQANLPALQATARNDRALANLAVAFTTAKAMTHYHKAADGDWPEGLLLHRS
jgi:hypothetical protein